MDLRLRTQHKCGFSKQGELDKPQWRRQGAASVSDGQQRCLLARVRALCKEDRPPDEPDPSWRKGLS